jgi:hypothetical protein
MSRLLVASFQTIVTLVFPFLASSYTPNFLME